MHAPDKHSGRHTWVPEQAAKQLPAMHMCRGAHAELEVRGGTSLQSLGSSPRCPRTQR